MGRGSRQALYSLIAIYVSNYSTGDLSESRDNSSDSDSDDSDSDSDSDDGSETESEFDDRPAQKKQKMDNSQHSRKGESPPICKMNKQI
jgi:cobalamin biosynthesis protein CobT